jgi:hypothetical protein
MDMRGLVYDFGNIDGDVTPGDTAALLWLCVFLLWWSTVQRLKEMD